MIVIYEFMWLNISEKIRTKFKAKDADTHFSWEMDMDLHFRLGRILIRSLGFWSVGFLTDPEQTQGTKNPMYI